MASGSNRVRQSLRVLFINLSRRTHLSSRLIYRKPKWGFQMNWRSVFMLLILPLAPEVCFAWGSEGHQIVGEIATGYLTDHSKQVIAALLENDLDSHSQPSGRKTLAEVSTWADEIRATPIGRRTAPWHYDNAPVCGQPHDVCPNGNCASVQLARGADHFVGRTGPENGPSSCFSGQVGNAYSDCWAGRRPV